MQFELSFSMQTHHSQKTRAGSQRQKLMDTYAEKLGVFKSLSLQIWETACNQVILINLMILKQDLVYSAYIKGKTE